MSKFKVWIDDNKVMTGDAGNVMTADVLNADVQRINGFKSGTDVSSQRVNSMIRQNSLVSKALMDISGDNTLDATSTLSDVINILKKNDNHIVNFTQASSLSNITSGDALSTSFGKINKQFNSLSNFMKEDENGVKLYASSDTTKGTIEERLTNLGFKEGSFILASGITATTNYIKKQGNIVYFKLVFKGLTELDIKNPPDNYYYRQSQIIGTIPDIFPSTGRTIPVKCPLRFYTGGTNINVKINAYSEFEISNRSCRIYLYAKNVGNNIGGVLIPYNEDCTIEGCYVISEPIST